ncbi:JAB domain-containing protein [Clostridium butyricum]|uniref:JAB domain-containing protein n=1 Tax=Clostridium butyricum TaxID=1492 RepID=UPI0022E43C2D|nr:JAB domain-containing protein [Clostridium butyricum]
MEIPVVTIKLIRTGKIKKRKQISSPKDVVNVIYEYLDGADRENLGIMCLNTKNEILNCTTAHIGSLNSSIVHPREVFKTAILSNAASIIIFHNHPSGNTTPSREDKNITQRLKEAGKILGIELIDSIVIGETIEDGYYSFKENIF